MAILKTANEKGKYYDEDARYDVVNYILYSDQAIRYTFFLLVLVYNHCSPRAAVCPRKETLP